MNTQDFVDSLFFGGGTNMVGDDGYTNDLDHQHTPEDPAPDCPACEGRWDSGQGPFT